MSVLEKKLRIGIIILILYVKSRIETQAKIFNSVASLDPLIETQAKVIRGIEVYLISARNRLKYIESHISYSKEKLKEAGKDPKYLLNPVNAFSFLNRVGLGFGFIKNMTKDRIGYYKDNSLLYPVQGDLQGAENAIVRLQTTYRMNITHLANGTLISNFSQSNQLYVEHVTPMITCDCYMLGIVSAERQGFSGQLQWMKEALKKHYAENCEICTVTEEAIVYKIFEAYYNLKEFKKAVQWLKRIIEKFTYRRQENKELLKETQERVDRGEGHKTRREQKLAWQQPTIKGLYGCYEKLRPRNKHKLKYFRCIYESRTPFLTYGPVKEETLSIAPNVAYFHDVMSDAEIDTLKSLAKPKLLDTGILNKENNKTIVSRNNDVRISKGALLDSTFPLVGKLAQRIGDITGYNMSSAMKLQVVNYGIGGIYSAHVDYMKLLKDSLPEQGDRLVAFIYFLSDVEQGGALVFPALGLKVYPKKGTAIAWSVLHPSGDGDLNMLHIACPVIRGSRWVAVNWPLERDQDTCPLWYMKDGIMTEEKYSKWILQHKTAETNMVEWFSQTFNDTHDEELKKISKNYKGPKKVPEYTIEINI